MSVSQLREPLFKALGLEMRFHHESFQYPQFLARQRIPVKDTIMVGLFTLKISEYMQIRLMRFGLGQSVYVLSNFLG